MCCLPARVAESPLIEYNTFIDNGAKGNGNAFFCLNTNNTTVVDSSGDVSPSGVWHYQTTAFNSICAAEGPR